MGGLPRLKGKVAIVTGSGQSIGRSIALLLAQQGAKVVVNSRRQVSADDTPTAADTLEEIRSAGGEATAVYADVGTAEGCEAIVDAAVDAFGSVDVLVNNAGGGTVVKSVVDMTDEEWSAGLASNLSSQFTCTRRALPVMQRAGWGRIVNIGSNVGLFGMPEMPAYAAAKAGSIGLTFAVAQELQGSGVTVNCVLPTAYTERNNRSRAEREAKTGHVLETSVLRTPDAVAPLVVHLCTDAAGGVTGQVFYTSGGQVTHYAWPPVPRTMLKDGHWTLDELDDLFPRYFGTELVAKRPPMPLT